MEEPQTAVLVLLGLVSVAYFKLKKTRGAPMGHPKFELLANNVVATFVMQFSITLNARNTHIKRART